MLEELTASRSSRRRAWETCKRFDGYENTAGLDLQPPARKTIDLEGRLVKDGVRKAIVDQKTLWPTRRCHPAISETGRPETVDVAKGPITLTSRARIE